MKFVNKTLFLVLSMGFYPGALKCISTQTYVFQHPVHKGSVTLVNDIHCEDKMPGHEKDLIEMQAQSIIAHARAVNALVIVEDMQNYTGKSTYVANLVKNTAHDNPRTLSHITQHGKKQGIECLNVEYRHERGYSLIGDPLSCGADFKRTGQVIDAISIYNDTPVLNAHYKNCLNQIVPIYQYFQQVFNSQRTFLLQLNQLTVRKKLSKKVNDISLFYDRVVHPKSFEEFISLYDWRLLNQQIIHEIYQKQCGTSSLHPQPIIVCAGAAHITEIASVLEHLMGYTLVHDSYQNDYHYRLQVQYPAGGKRTIWALLDTDKFFSDCKLVSV